MSTSDYKEFLELRDENAATNYHHFSKEMDNLEELYHILIRYSTPFFNHDDIFYLDEFSSSTEAIVSVNNNSIISLFDGVINLIYKANQVSVNVLHRSIFEFLIINNHLILTKDPEYVERWLGNKDVKIVKNILKKTDNRNFKELIDFWVSLSRQNHASSNTAISELDWLMNSSGHFNNIFVTYILLYFYNYQLRELYFPSMQSFFKKQNIKTKSPFKSNWFDKKDKIREFEKDNYNEKLYLLLKAFTFKWNLK